MTRMRTRSELLAVLLAGPLAASCATIGAGDLPEKLPPLSDMEEPLALHEEPKDEAARRALPLGAFTGVTAADARKSLDEIDGDPVGVRVQKVIENSPADAAGIDEDDLLLAVAVDGGPARELDRPSEWRKAEIDASGGSRFRVTLDRAGDERTVELTATARVRPTERAAAQRFREERKVGVVLRTATEVEARAAGLGPGGGAVVVGLSGGSPWRPREDGSAGGVRFGDLLAAVGGRPVAHPQEVIAAIQDARPGSTLRVAVVRDGATRESDLPLSRREQQVTDVRIPLLFTHEKERGSSETSVLAGLVRTRSTPAAWDCRILWIISFGGGDADRLEEVDR
ncbi:MAG: hypothetical protein HMLKMBBP_00889 [Planctomycetes bacterium]|nr:hypothetical protein [Planctomycetota bacterium]